MRGIIQRCLIVALLLGTLAPAALVIRSYRQFKAQSVRIYTLSVSTFDIRDTARNALSALDNAEIHEQDYVLTGETVYSEAYLANIRKWQDEFGSLELVAMKDPALPLVQELSKAGTRTLSELALVLAVYEKDGQGKALERIRKGAASVYLDQARQSVAKILETDTEYFNGNVGNLQVERIVIGCYILFAVACISTLFLLFEIRKGRRYLAAGAV